MFDLKHSRVQPQITVPQRPPRPTSLNRIRRLFTCNVVTQDAGGDDVAALGKQLLQVGLGQVFGQP